ncbi:saccharopine dehydrogenase NADP-binding domain-containing protein [Aliidiomarina quisquiliarum]|uniref:saccharopine dehydrogenase NADP-binding domain-containing protein n=1 Tax=Aliidiomarina quisquiliarum TaxID=2938947 RepID=UPI00208E52D9|nr:saccharopine dehydrogenase NADP-binding domain-containing protein [Aliidiomarina quisquiliarum]MCO4321591.1 saccharopine dehydrogenase NADP-binding domain-containing protein [Aliidiomarina quisquiliarum]
MSKILVLGGAGTEGSVLARDLVISKVEEVVLADFNIERAQELAKELQSAGNSKVTAVKADANKHDELVSLIKEENPNVVCNLIGPFYKFGEPIVKAVIEAGVPYVDINDDYKPTLEIMKNLNDAAIKANIPVIIGAGVSPGLTNLFSKHAFTQLDETDDITIDWIWPSLAGGGPGVFNHFFHILSGDSLQFVEGKHTGIPAGTEKTRLTSTDAKYNGDIFYVGHAEPATIPRYIDGVQNVTVRGGLIPTAATELYFKFMEAGLNDDEPIEVNGKTFNLAEVSMGIMERRFKDVKEAKDVNGYFKVTVEGKKDGFDKKYIYEIAENGAHMTAWTASTIAQTIAEGKINYVGVHAPEVLDREQIETIFSKLKDKGFTIKISEE